MIRFQTALTLLVMVKGYQSEYLNTLSTTDIVDLYHTEFEDDLKGMRLKMEELVKCDILKIQ